MTNENQEILEKRYKRIDIANRFRLFFMVVAVIALILIMISNRLIADMEWYPRFRSYVIMFTAWDILFMVLASFVKIFFTMQYNQAVKKANKQ